VLEDHLHRYSVGIILTPAHADPAIVRRSCCPMLMKDHFDSLILIVLRTVRSRYKRQLIRLNMNKKWPTRTGMEDSRPIFFCKRFSCNENALYRAENCPEVVVRSSWGSCSGLSRCMITIILGIVVID